MSALNQLFARFSSGKVRRPLPPTDAIFLIDSSDEVTTDVYERQKDIIKSITRSFDIGLAKTRVAVIAYSDRGRNVIEFDTYGNILDLHKGIDTIPYLGGRRRLDVAVTQANALLSETRPKVNHSQKIEESICWRGDGSGGLNNTLIQYLVFPPPP